METVAACQICLERSEWDFLKDFFLREQSLLQQYEIQKSQHEKNRQELESALAAVRLSYYSAQAHLTRLQDRYTELEVANCDLYARCTALEVELEGARQRHTETETRSVELRQVSDANTQMIQRQKEELYRQTSELNAAEAAARELGDMMNEVVSANDFATASFKGAVNVADLVMRNKYLESELADMKALLGCLQSDDLPELDGCASTVESSSSYYSFIPLPEEDTTNECPETSSAYDNWEAYRELHPLQEDDLQ